MRLQSLVIKNFRPLEHVFLDKLGQFNVLIGRNNAGKTSVFDSLALLAFVMTGKEMTRPMGSQVLTDQDTGRALEMCLTFMPQQRDREEFIDLLVTAGYDPGRRTELVNSPLLRRMEYSFRSAAGNPTALHLYETKLWTENDHYAVVQQIVSDEGVANPRSKVLVIGTAVRQHAKEAIDTRLLDLDRQMSDEDPTGSVLQPVATEVHMQLAQWKEPWHADPATTWPQHRLARYLASAYFFNPFRHSSIGDLPVQHTLALSQNGINLAQVLHTISSNDRAKFAEIESFMNAALPDIGALHAPLTPGNSYTNVAFRSSQGTLIPLHDMGGGIEQLLMVATVLLTTDNESTLFVEEPENHLHAGAQRLLLEKLTSGERQVFITTHSPTFVNLWRPHSLYQVTYTRGRTTIERRDDSGLDTILEDIGARNSDVLLSDAVLFVEGPGDKHVMEAWSETLGASLTEHNVTVLPMGGGQYAGRSAPVRSEVLTGISQRAPVPHIFMLDRDERGHAEIERLEKHLGSHLHLLKAREIENYLLVPRALLAAVRSKHQDNALIVEKVDQSSEKEVQQLIETAASGLFDAVLMKRICSELGGLVGGFLPRELVNNLAPQARDPNLPNILLEAMKLRVDEHFASLNVSEVVEHERMALEGAWSDSAQRLMLAPGADIVASVLRNFGSDYNKPADTLRIAQELCAEEINTEIAQVIRRAANLANQRSE